MNRLEVVAGFVKRLGNKNYNVNTFQNRLIVQKLIFILQGITGLKLYNDFSLYVHGPYSTSLTKDFYRINDTTKYEEYGFSEGEDEQRLSDLVQMIEPYSNDAPILELTSTILFVQKVMNLKPTEMIIRKLKPRFSDEQYTQAINLAKALRTIEKR